MKFKTLISKLALAVIFMVFWSCTDEANQKKEEIDSSYDYSNSKIVYDYDMQTTALDKKKGPGTWSSLSVIPQAIEGASVATLGDDIIVALGFSFGFGDSDFTHIYNIPSNSWSLGSVAPGSSSEGAGTSHGGLFYSVGGRGPAASALWSYNLQGDVWTILPSMPTARSGLGVATVGNNLYAIGGRSGTGGPNSFGKLSVVEKYDIDAGTWSTVASLPSARSDLAAVAHGGKIYVMGGFNSGSFAIADVDVYNPVTDSWSTAPADLPTPRGGLYGAGITGGVIFAIGGWDGISFPGSSGSVVEGYKVSKDTWSTSYAPMPTARGEAGVASHGGRIYMVGGGTPAFGTPIASMEVFKP